VRPVTESSPPHPDSCLHLVVGAGAEALEDCLLHSRARDDVLFLDAGVQHLLHDGSGPVVGLAEAHYIDADLRAHGLLESARRSRVRVIDDAGFCKLLATHRHCLTWT
jgi:sulfur relay protein TusB/DsrH